MKYLQPTWIRIIVSLLLGAVVAEFVHISTGDPNRPHNATVPMLAFGVIAYCILTYFAKKSRAEKP